MQRGRLNGQTHYTLHITPKQNKNVKHHIQQNTLFCFILRLQVQKPVITASPIICSLSFFLMTACELREDIGERLKYAEQKDGLRGMSRIKTFVPLEDVWIQLEGPAEPLPHPADA